MMIPSTDNDQVFEACNRFFAITELVVIFLEKASTQVLMSCQRVCNTWKDVIDRSDKLQERLFLRPAAGDQAIQLNPLLQSHFSPILGGPLIREEAYDREPTEEMISRHCNASHLLSLPWARDGMDLDAKARQAFARPEASWRNMLVSQPPITRLDWWHEWIEKSFVSEDPENGAWEICSRARGGTDIIRGWGHQDLNDTHITIGLLWDLVEARLVRGCWTTVMYFATGKRTRPPTRGNVDSEVDHSATMVERRWASGRDSGQRRGWTDRMPRVKLRTTQIWDGVPHQQGFHAETGQWISMPEAREQRPADGFNLLRQDCVLEDDKFPRWSKSEAFQWREIDGESSAGG